MSIDAPFYDEGDRTILLGDNLAHLREISDGFFDNVVSDPPYGLGFMGKEWDADVPTIEFWREVLRVCKPGAMALIFAGTRTYPFMALNLVQAGWELRDCLMWLYGTGFPKSYDVSKALDKMEGHWRGKAGKATSMNFSMSAPNYERTEKGEPITAAAAFDGYGTALKPAWEPIMLLMKPTDGTFAENALTHGVAGLNIGATRIGSEARYNPPAHNNLGPDDGAACSADDISGARGTVGKSCVGRWPSNVLLDEAAAEMLDEQSGNSKSRVGDGQKRMANRLPYAFGAQGLPTGGTTSYDDEGGASRFFYVAKPTEKDKGYYNIHPTVKPTKLMEYLLKLVGTPTGGVTLDPFMGSGTTLVAAKKLGRVCVGMERDRSYCEVAQRRLEESL